MTSGLTALVFWGAYWVVGFCFYCIEQRQWRKQEREKEERRNAP